MSHGAHNASGGLNVEAATSPPNQSHKFQQCKPDHAGTILESTGAIAFAAVHQRLRWQGEDTSFFGVAFDDGTMFLSRRRPPVYDARAKKIASTEIPSGSTVKVRYRVEGRINWLDAIQIVSVAEEECPFTPVMDHA